MNKKEQQYHELSFYTLSHPDPAFIHQHIVDAYTAQTANEKTKAISITFSLAGLYLYIEKKFTGKQVQQFHQKMAENKKEWPELILPEKRGNIDVSGVLAASPGPERDKMIRKWCKSVWNAYKDNRAAITDLVEQYEKPGF
jgi:flavodoxin